MIYKVDSETYRQPNFDLYELLNGYDIRICDEADEKFCNFDNPKELNPKPKIELYWIIDFVEE